MALISHHGQSRPLQLEALLSSCSREVILWPAVHRPVYRVPELEEFGAHDLQLLAARRWCSTGTQFLPS